MGWRKPFSLDWINHKSAIRCSYITPKLGHALAAMYQTSPQLLHPTVGGRKNDLHLAIRGAAMKASLK